MISVIMREEVNVIDIIFSFLGAGFRVLEFSKEIE